MRVFVTRAAAGVAAATVLLAAPGPIVSPAAAAGTGDAVILSPQGEIVPYGWTGPITVDFSEAEIAKYYIDVECNLGYFHRFEFTSDADTTLNDFTLGSRYPVRGGSHCDVSVRDWNENFPEAWGSFEVATAPADVTILKASPREFYPIHRDGYRDRTKITYRVEGPAENATVIIRNGSGRTVFTTSRRLAFASGRWTWAWNGRNNRGGTVKVGRYRVTIRVTGNDGTLDADSIRVRVRR